MEGEKRAKGEKGSSKRDHGINNCYLGRLVYHYLYLVIDNKRKELLELMDEEKMNDRIIIIIFLW